MDYEIWGEVEPGDVQQILNENIKRVQDLPDRPNSTWSTFQCNYSGTLLP